MIYDHAPSIVEQYARWRVPEEWQERVKRIRPDAWVIFNPILMRYAIVACTPRIDRGQDVEGYDYPGVEWLMNVEHEDHSFREVDDGVLAEFHARHHRGHRQADANERARRRGASSKENPYATHRAKADGARKAQERKEISEATDAAMTELIEPHAYGRVLTTGAGKVEY